MALSNQLGQAELKPESINTTATVTVEKLDSGFAVTEVHLEVTARVPNATEAQFDKAAQEAKTGCPISKLFNTKITMSAKLEAKAAV